MDEKNIIVVKEVDADTEYSDLEDMAKHMRKQLGNHVNADAHIAYGTIVNDIKEVLNLALTDEKVSGAIDFSAETNKEEVVK